MVWAQLGSGGDAIVTAQAVRRLSASGKWEGHVHVRAENHVDSSIVYWFPR